MLDSRLLIDLASRRLTHLSDGALLRDLQQHVASERGGTAEVLADLAEVDARKLYLPAAYPSTYAFCIGELRFSEEAAYKRIRAARMARRFPAIFAAVADGRLHLSAIVLLASYLTTENVEELLAAAMGRSKLELEQLLAQRFPRPDLAAQVIAVSECELSPGTVEATTPLSLRTPSLSGALAPTQVEATLPAPALTIASQLSRGIVERPRVAPLALERYALQCTVSQRSSNKSSHCSATRLLRMTYQKSLTARSTL